MPSSTTAISTRSSTSRTPTPTCAASPEYATALSSRLRTAVTSSSCCPSTVRAAHAADVEPDVLGLGGGAGAVDGLGQHRVDVHERGLAQRTGHLQAGQLDDLVHERRQPGRLGLHPAGEPAHGLGVVGRVLHGLGQQRQRTDGRLELVRDVHDEVTTDRLEPTRLRQVLGEHDQVLRADLRHPHLDQQHARTDRAARHLELLVADHAVPAHAGDQVADRGRGDATVAHDAERVRRGARPHHLVVLVEDDGGRAQHGERADEALVELRAGRRPAPAPSGRARSSGTPGSPRRPRACRARRRAAPSTR